MYILKTLFYQIMAVGTFLLCWSTTAHSQNWRLPEVPEEQSYKNMLAFTPASWIRNGGYSLHYLRKKSWGDLRLSGSFSYNQDDREYEADNGCTLFSDNGPSVNRSLSFGIGAQRYIPVSNRVDLYYTPTLFASVADSRSQTSVRYDSCAPQQLPELFEIENQTQSVQVGGLLLGGLRIRISPRFNISGDLSLVSLQHRWERESDYEANFYYESTQIEPDITDTEESSRRLSGELFSGARLWLGFYF